MNGFASNAMSALGNRFRGELEQTSGMSLEQVQQAVQNGDEKGLCWLQKKVEQIRKENPRLYSTIESMARGRNPFPGSK